MATTWRPPPEIARRLRVTSVLVDRSANEIITEAVSQWLDRNQPAETTALIEKSAEDKTPPRS